jgi:EmrB/QacA subfamily drug resistance transporter
MTEEANTRAPAEAPANQRLALLLAMAMFVLVVDTSLMNVSIASVVRDLDTTVSGVQSAIALEALVSAAFILIGSKVGDLIGRKRAYMLGLLGYAVGALAMSVAQNLAAIIIFWALVGGLGASLLLPAMQALIHGNFEGAAQKKAYALVGAAAAIAAAVGPLLGGFITTYLSWRLAFLLEVTIIAIVLSGHKLVHDVPYTGPRHIDAVGAILSVLGMGGIVLGILVWQEGGESVGAVLAVGAIAVAGLVYWLVRRKRQGEPTLIDPDLFRSKIFRLGITQQVLQQIALGGTMIVLPIYLQMVLEYNAMQAGLSLAPLSLTMFAIAILAGKKARKRRPSGIIRIGFALLTAGLVVLIPLVPRVDSGWYLLAPLVIVGSGLGLLVSQLNNYTLAPISDERVSEAAGVNSAAGSFGLSFGLAFRRCHHARSALDILHQQGREQHCASPGRTTAHRRSAGARRRGDEQYQAQRAACRPTSPDSRRDHPHQHRLKTACPSNSTVHSDSRWPRRSVQLVPHGAPTSSFAIKPSRTDSLGLKRSDASGQRLHPLGVTPRDAGSASVCSLSVVFHSGCVLGAHPKTRRPTSEAE